MDAIFDIQRFANDSAELNAIKKFMAALDTTTLSGTAALNEAVKACSNFSTAQEAINQLISDQNKSASTSDFLLNYCGINLNNSDTGAITGSDAGGNTTKTATSVVPESGAASYPSSTTFTKRGLTVTVPEKSSLTSTQQVIVQGLYSWWIEEALKLVEESTGYSFTDSDATVAKISIEFTDDSTSGSLAYISNYWDTSNSFNDKLTKMALKEGITKKLKLTINSAYYSNIYSDEVNGYSNYGYLDRTLAHELTHAIMAAKVNYYDNLPLFLKEGLAELVHGADDNRQSDINYLAGNSSALKSALSLNSATSYSSTAGYILLRYLAKQADTNTNGDELYIEGTSGADNISNSLTGATINALAGNDTITNTGSHATINGGAGKDSIVNTNRGGALSLAGAYSYIDAGADDDYILNYDYANYVTVNAGDGNDTIFSRAAESTIYGGAGNDSIRNVTSNVFISGGDGNDIILDEGFISGINNKNTINGGKGNDIITLSSSGYNNVIQYANGDGNDIIYNISATDTLQITGASYTTSGSDLIIGIGSGSITVSGGANVDFTIDGTIKSDFTEGNDNYTNTNSNVYLNAFGGNDYIYNDFAYYVTVNAGNGADTIYNNYGNYASIIGGAGNDSIFDGSAGTTTDGGDGDDIINGYVVSGSINGGAGNDRISLVSNDGMFDNYSRTIKGGTGNDTIYGFSNSTGGILYQYANGDGYDFIYNPCTLRAALCQIQLRAAMILF